MFMTEEDIRGKLLLPYLKDLGFDVSQILLEKSFTLRLGKQKHKVGGRADILCKCQGKNLFIIELKNESISISEADILQGISYATSLIDGIAPFTMITNGKTTKVFDSISRKELTGTRISDQSPFYKNGYTLSTDEELKIRYEALLNFISLSSENLKIFCESQVRDRMGSIIGNIDDPYSKYIKELHVQRKDLQFAFKKFISSDESFFGLVGVAGVGKTSAMCSLALQCLEDNFVFFYNAALISKSPLEHIAQDLNVVFSSKSESDSVLKKLDELGRSVNKCVVIFIDGIDECTNANISLDLSEIALAVKNLDKVKICISCKSNIWNEILKINNTPTHLYEQLYKFHNAIDGLENCPGFLLTDFNDEEIKHIIPLYQSVFGFKGVIVDSLLKELRNGFFLRIFSEVYSNKQIPEVVNDKELIGKYLRKSLGKTTIGVQNGTRILTKIGKILISHKYDEWQAHKDEGLDVNYLLDRLDFSLDNNISEELFARNLLIKSNKEDSYNISFYYSKIRDYIVCYHAYKLDKQGNSEFQASLYDFYQNHIGKSAIDFYIENATRAHKDTLIRFKKENSLKYVIGYNSFLDHNFKKFKKEFNPRTEGEIGIILPKDILKGDGYALFPMDAASQSKIQLESLDDPFNEPYNENPLIKKGVQSVYGSNNSLMVPDQNMIIKKNIFEQLKKIIENGKLKTYNSDILLFEKVSTIVYFYYNKLDYEFKIEEFQLPRYEIIYPIDLIDLKDRINKFRVIQYYSRKNVNRKFTDDLVKDFLKKNLEIPKFEVIGQVPPFEELYEIVELLLHKGHHEIKGHYLPLPDKSVIEAKEFYEQNRKENYHQIRIAQFSETQAILYITAFFGYLESCYKEFVEDYFPTFKEEFAFYKTIPHEYFFYMKDSNVHKWGVFGYRTSRSGKIEINFKDMNQRDEAYREEGISILRSFSLDLILKINHTNRYPVQTINKIKTPKVDEFCVIRNWVYKFFEYDMENLFKFNEENHKLN